MFETIAAEHPNRIRKISGPISLLLHAAAAAAVALTALWRVGDPGEPPVVLPPFYLAPPVSTLDLAPSRSAVSEIRRPSGHQSATDPGPVPNPRALQPAPLTQEFTFGLGPSPSLIPSNAASAAGNGSGVDEADGDGGTGPCPPSCSSGPIDVGGRVVAPVPISQPSPPFPEPLRRARTEGTVLLRAVIGLDGAVEDLRVEHADADLFAEAAKSSVARWKYRPATLDGRPVRVFLDVAVNFRLQ